MTGNTFVEYLRVSLFINFTERWMTTKEVGITDELKAVSVEVRELHWVGSILSTEVEIPFVVIMFAEKSSTRFRHCREE